MIDDPNTPDSGSGLDVGLNRPVKFKNGIKKNNFFQMKFIETQAHSTAYVFSINTFHYKGRVE